MISEVYQLISPRTFLVEHKEINTRGSDVVIRPNYMALCHADQRYYMGTRSAEILRKKLPMALIHEACGTVVFDPTGTYKVGQTVLMIPNIPVNFNEEYYENYGIGTGFRSSGIDGFMREYVNLPVDRTVPYDDIDPVVAAMSEFVSVSVHAVTRFKKLSASRKETIGIWGDGNLAYVTAIVLKKICPECKVHIIGLMPDKLLNFSFVTQTHLASDLSDDFIVDHAFECAGGLGCEPAYKQIIKHIAPQGMVALMGVSENTVPMNTRDVLEKGITLVGCSRSGRIDFEKVVEILSDVKTQKRLRRIISFDHVVRNLSEVHDVFKEDYSSPSKTVFKWEV
ncbi:MAG: alcohol dehydrogenase catalytic domain-containing protein [Clostridia bacterium]